MGNEPPYPESGPPFGNRLLPQVIEDEVARDPTRVVGILANAASSPFSFTHITVKQLSEAIDLTAFWIDSQLDPSEQSSSEPIAYVGLQDFRYWVMELAGMKTGHPILLFSPRNALVNNVSLFTHCCCRTLVYSDPFERLAEQNGAAMPGLKILRIPTFEEIFNIHGQREEAVKPYPYNKTWDEARMDPVLILHTSGSTGPPKPVHINPAYIGVIDSLRLIPDVDGRKAASPALLAGKITYVGVPMFHLGGLVFSIPSLFYDSITLLGPVDRVSSAEVLGQLMSETKVQAIVGVPTLLEGLVKDYAADFIENSKNLELVLYTGGPISQSAGDFIVANTHAQLSQTYGSTETGPCHILMPSRKNWAEFNFHPTHGPEFEVIDEVGSIFEVVVRRKEAQIWAQCVFLIFPHLTEWRTKDLFKRKGHGVWIFQGRTDDVINLKGPGKVNPVFLEGRLQSLPNVHGALVFGNGRLKCGLIVELRGDAEYVPEDVWNEVEIENGSMPEHARIERHMILRAKKEKPFVRAGKGTVVRAQTLEEYEVEIEELYKQGVLKGLAN